VDVEDGLAGGFATVADDAIAVGIEMQTAGDLRRANHQSADESGLAVIEIVKRGDVAPGNDEDVRRRLRIDVVKGEDLIVFEDLPRRDLAVRDAAEETFVVCHSEIISEERSGP